MRCIRIQIHEHEERGLGAMRDRPAQRDDIPAIDREQGKFRALSEGRMRGKEPIQLRDGVALVLRVTGPQTGGPMHPDFFVGKLFLGNVVSNAHAVETAASRSLS